MTGYRAYILGDIHLFLRLTVVSRGEPSQSFLQWSDRLLGELPSLQYSWLTLLPNSSCLMVFWSMKCVVCCW